MDADLVIEALNSAYVNQRPKKGEVIFHSDLGSQYTSSAFIEQIKV